MNPPHQTSKRLPTLLAGTLVVLGFAVLVMLRKTPQPAQAARAAVAPALAVAPAQAPVSAAPAPAEAHPLEPSIQQPLVFTDGKLAGVVDPAAIESIGSRELFMDEGRWNNFVILNDQLVTTATLADYEQALAAGGKFHGRISAVMASDFVAGRAIWHFLRQARRSQASPFAAGWLKRLPVELVFWQGSDEEQQRQEDAQAGKTISDYLQSGILLSLNAKAAGVEFSCGMRDVEVTWLASGDLDHDGLEDRLLLITTRATEGSALGHETFVASQSPAAPGIITLREFPEKNSVWH